MKIKITAKRWDEPIEYEVKEVRFVAEGTQYALMYVDNNSTPSLRVELNEDYGEKIEVIA